LANVLFKIYFISVFRLYKKIKQNHQKKVNCDPLKEN